MESTIVSFEQALASLTRCKAPIYRAVEYYLSEAIAVLAVKRVYSEFYPQRATERFGRLNIRLSEREGWPQFLSSTLTDALQDLFPIHESWLDELIFNEEAGEWLIPVLDCGLYICYDITNILEFDEGNPMQSLPMFLAILNGLLDALQLGTGLSAISWG